MADLDLGSIVVSIQLAADQLEQTADAAVQKLNAVGEQGEKAQKKLNPLNTTLKNTGDTASSAAQGVNAFGNALELTGNTRVDKLSTKLEKLNASMKTQQGVVNKLSAELDDLASGYAELEKSAERSGDFDLNAVFPKQTAALDKEISKLDELKKQIRLTTQERNAAATAAEQSAQKQEQLNQKMANKTATNSAKVGLDATAMAIRGVSSAAGGAVGNLGYLATEIVFLKRTMDEGIATGTAFAAIFSVGIMAAVTIVTTAVQAVQAAEEKRQKAFDEGVSNLKKYSSELETLERNLAVLQDQKSTTNQLVTARNNLAGTFSNLIVGYTDEGDAILASNDAIQKYITSLEEKNRLSRQEILSSGAKDVENYRDKAREVKEYADAVKYYQEELAINTQNPDYLPSVAATERELQNAVDRLSKSQRELLNQNDGVSEYFRAYLQEGVRASDSVSGLTKAWADLDSEQTTVANNFILNAVDKYLTGTLSIEDAVKQLNDLLSDPTQVEKYFNSLTKAQESEKAAKALEAVNKVIDDQISSMGNLQSAYASLADGQKLSIDQLYELAQAYPEVAKYIAETGDLSLQNGKILAQVYESKRQTFIEEQKMRLTDLEEQKAGLEAAVANAKAHILAAEAIGMAAEAASASMNYSDASKNLDDTNKRIEEIKTLLASFEKINVDFSVDSSKSSRNEALQKELELLDHKKRMNELTYSDELAWLERIQSTLIKSDDEQLDMEYRIYSLKKSHEAELLSDQYKQMSDKKALGQLTLQQELSWLEQLRDQYRMTAEERIALEIKIFNVKQSLQKSEASALTDLGTAITTALKKKYADQQKAEQAHIQSSIDGWNNWKDSTTDAIQAEIKALDELDKAQNREEQRAEYERQRQALALQLGYEKDDYQRKQIQKQLNSLDQDESKRLQQVDKEDKKQALQDQLSSIQEMAQARVSGLQTELTAVNDIYGQMTDTMALETEAQRILMEGNQADIVQLLKDYAPEYANLGKTFGERMADAFRDKVQNILSYIDEINNKIQEFTGNVAATANKAADNFQAAQAQMNSTANTYNASSTVNFYNAVDSPIAARRAVDSVAEDLARRLGG